MPRLKLSVVHANENYFEICLTVSRVDSLKEAGLDNLLLKGRKFETIIRRV